VRALKIGPFRKLQVAGSVTVVLLGAEYGSNFSADVLVRGMSGEWGVQLGAISLIRARSAVIFQ